MDRIEDVYTCEMKSHVQTSPLDKHYNLMHPNLNTPLTIRKETHFRFLSLLFFCLFPRHKNCFHHLKQVYCNSHCYFLSYLVEWIWNKLRISLSWTVSPFQHSFLNIESDSDLSTHFPIPNSVTIVTHLSLYRKIFRIHYTFVYRELHEDFNVPKYRQKHGYINGKTCNSLQKCIPNS